MAADTFFLLLIDNSICDKGKKQEKEKIMSILTILVGILAGIGAGIGVGFASMNSAVVIGSEISSFLPEQFMGQSSVASTIAMGTFSCSRRKRGKTERQNLFLVKRILFC